MQRVERPWGPSAYHRGFSARHFRGSSGSAPTAAHWDTAVPVRLPYSRRVFFVPDNVYVVATTNSTDRSVAPLDQAIRRRFAFYRIEPDVRSATDLADQLPKPAKDVALASARMVKALNDAVLAPCLGPDAMLGPSYLYQLIADLKAGAGADAARRIWQYSIIPQLIDVARSYGAEGLLDATTRGDWLAEHGSELVDEAEVARAALRELDTYLRGVGIKVSVEGTGLARGARVLPATTTRVDIADVPLELGEELAEAVRP